MRLHIRNREYGTCMHGHSMYGRMSMEPVCVALSLSFPEFSLRTYCVLMFMHATFPGDVCAVSSEILDFYLPQNSLVSL